MNNEELEHGVVMQVATKIQNREAARWLNTVETFDDSARQEALLALRNKWEGLEEKSKIYVDGDVQKMALYTNNGWVNVNDGDFIIKTKDGEFYPCAEATFLESYGVIKNDTAE